MLADFYKIIQYTRLRIEFDFSHFVCYVVAVEVHSGKDDWDSSIFNSKFNWLTEHLVPADVRLGCKAFLEPHQCERLREIAKSNGDKIHNEILLMNVAVHGRVSYDHFVNILSGMKGMYRQVGEELRAACGGSTLSGNGDLQAPRESTAACASST